MRALSRLALVLMVLLTGPAFAQTQPELSGDVIMHDPSVLHVEGRFVAFATGNEGDPNGGLPRMKTSADGLDWKDAGPLPGSQPAWIAEELGYTPKNIWAPSISTYGGRTFLYYSASSFGNQDSAIGLMINDAFDPAAPGDGWVDQGMVIRSHKGDSFNAIDPFRFDDASGSWLAFGSWWDGIRLIPLDPQTGLRLDDSAPVAIASRQGPGIEAPAIIQRGEWYYLFTSFDHCCRGAASDYRIMIGRAAEITGLYLDRNGLPLPYGGGSEVLVSEGRRRGPGGQEAFMVGDEYWLAWHYYDRLLKGLPKLQIARLHFDADGWPFLSPAPEE